MKHVNQWFLFLFVLSFILLFSVITCSAEDTTVRITPSQQLVSPGDSFSFNVTCTPGQPVKSFELKLCFDPSLMSVSSVSEGLFFDGFDTFFNDGDIDNTNGKITDVYNLILGQGNVSSEQSMITVSCIAKDSIGQILIDLYDVGVTDEDGYLTISVIDGVVSVQDDVLLYNANPSNGSDSVNPELGSISLDIEHITGELFNYSITTNPDIGSHSASFQSNGTKSCSISSLEFNSIYEYTVSVQEVSSGQWTNQTYLFETRSMTAEDVITLSNPSPSNGANEVSVDLSEVSIGIRHSTGESFNYSIETSPNVGSISNNFENNGTKTCALSDLSFDTTYTWTVSVYDSSTNGWLNDSFSFTVESEPEDNNPGGGGIPPGGGGGFFPPAPVENQNNAPYKPVKPSGPLYIEPGGRFSYEAQTYDPDGDLIRYQFQWGDGNVSNWTEFVSGNQTVTMSHQWMQIDNFSIQVIAQDEEGLNSSWSEALIVYCSFGENDSSNGSDPVAMFESVEIDKKNLSFTFNANASYDEDGSITSFIWDFGDGTTSTEVNPSHSFAEPGWYNVTLMVTDNDGNVYSKTVSVFAQGNVGSNDDETEKEGSFPWIYLSIGFAGVAVVVVVFGKRIFSLFFEIVEVDENNNPVDQSVEYEGTFVDQVRHVEQKLNPFHLHSQNHHRSPIGFQADSHEESDDAEQEKKQSPKHRLRDIHFIRNQIDAHFSKEDEEDE